MGWFSGKRMGDPGAYTFQQVLTNVVNAIELAEKNKSNLDSNLEIEITVRGGQFAETIKIPQESLREVVAILKLNSDFDEHKEQ
jgi:hypothetical protein